MERESVLEIFIEHSPVALAMFDKNMCYLANSDRWRSDLKIGDVRILGRSHYDVFPDVPERWKEIHRRALNGEVVRSEEDLYERLDNSKQWFRWEVQPWFNSGGVVGGIVIFFEDITDRILAEKDRARLAAIVESSEDAIISKSLDGTIVTWNRGAERIFGFTQEEAVGRSILIIVPPEKEPEEIDILGRLSLGETVEHFETVRVNKDGQRLFVSLSISPIRNAKGEIIGASKITRDITSQKLATDALRQRELLLRTATDNAAVGLVMLNRDRQYIFVNAAYPRIFKFETTAEELIGKRPSELLGDVYETKIAPHLDRAFSGERVSFDFTRSTSNTATGHYLVVYDPLRDDSSVVNFVIVTVCDITPQKSAEADLKDSKERLEFALESSQIGAWDLDLKSGEASYRSTIHHRIFGHEEPVNVWNLSSFLEHVLPEDRERVSEVFQRSLATKCDWTFECRIVRSDQQIRWISVAGRPKCNEDGNPVRMIGIVQDVTEKKQDLELRRKLESQIQHAQKLESLGVLAGGIAHDFNNILTSILGYTDLAQNELPSHSTALAYIRQAANGACKAAELTKQMLAYSGKGKFVVQSLCLNDLIEDMIHLLQVSISKKCVLKLHLMPGLPSVEADATQMRQIVMNLIINASDAIGERSGVVAITTGIMHCDRSYLSETYLDENLAEGPYVFVEIADTGCGMDEQTRERIFDPFFTTKSTGRGLGLAAVLGIVRGHKGVIKIYSELTKGTTFKVAFPAIDLPAHIRDEPSVEDQKLQFKGTVLVVDDEDSVRSLFQCALESIGFNVLTARNGREGLDVYSKNYTSIDLVVLDMNMPHMDGPQCFRELRRVRPDVKAILTSGYNEQSAISQFAGKGLAGFLQKPFRFDQLVDVVRRVAAN